MNAATATRGAAPSAPVTDDYFTRAVPEPWRILGLQLKPLSVGRYRLLKRFEVAFVAEGEAQAGVPDLLLGVLICSMRVDEFLEFSASPHFARDIRRWSKRVFPHVWLCALPWIGKWWRQRAGFNVIEKLNLFQKYIEAAQEIPRYTLRENSPSTNTSHWSHSLEICLRSELGWTAEEINEAPLSKALADYFRFAESRGQVILLSDEDLAQAAHNAECFNAAAKEWEARHGA